MEAAIARGQGRSLSGLALENLNFEVILPSTVAAIIEVETDNKARTQMELRMLIKQHKGNVTPTNFLFQKKGRIAFEKDERNLTVDDVLEEAIEAGAEDVETDEDGSIVVWTDASSTTSAIQALQKSLDLKLESSDIIWDSNEETRIHLLDEPAKALSEFLDALDENPQVQAVYANVAQGSLADDTWETLASRLAA